MPAFNPNRTEVIIDNKKVLRKLNQIDLMVQGGSKQIRDALRKGARPWPNAVNGKVYNYINRITGSSEKPIGLQTWYAKEKNEYGVKARAIIPRSKKLLKKQSGWRIHFFATPAYHIRRIKRIPFDSMYRQQTGNVVRSVGARLYAVIRNNFG
jgi:hypothetical protein